MDFIDVNFDYFSTHSIGRVCCRTNILVEFCEGVFVNRNFQELLHFKIANGILNLTGLIVFLYFGYSRGV